MITCISYENIFTASAPNCINIAPLQTRVICVTVADGIYNTDYTGLNWSNIKLFLKIYSKYNFIADAGNHSQMMNDKTIENHFFLCNIIGNQSLKCTLLQPCEITWLSNILKI